LPQSRASFLRMKAQTPPFTFGIEEEYHLVDLATRDLKAAPAGFMDACKARLGDRVSPEFLATQIEIGTPVCRSFKEARAEVARLRGAIGEIAKGYNMAPIAAGTHPFADTIGLPTTDKERYRVIAVDLAGIGRRMSMCGMHVHVGIDDPDTRIDIMNQMRYFLPHLLVLSTSSPFWKGVDTGLKSYRLAIVDESPRTGLPDRFTSWTEYQETVNVLVRAGILEDASDVATRLDDTIAIAALYVCIARMLYRLRRDNLCWRTYPVFLLEENRWRAQRYGARGELFDFGKGTLVPFSQLIAELTARVAEDADALGCEAEVAHCRTIVARGTSADRQVSVHERAIAAGRSSEDALRTVVDHIIAETLAG
jgi:glutamate---cysteine ligase / carboxylate-amine ligase